MNRVKGRFWTLPAAFLGVRDFYVQPVSLLETEKEITA